MCVDRSASRSAVPDLSASKMSAMTFELEPPSYSAEEQDPSVPFIHYGNDVMTNLTTAPPGVNAAMALNESMNEIAQIAEAYGVRFIPYTVLSVCCFIFNILSLSAMTKIRGHRTVHHTLLLNLAVGDMFGSVLLWMYYNSPVIFPMFPITRLEHCLFVHLALVAPFILSLCMSSLSLLMLALNQYIAICSPLFSATRVTKSKASIFIVVAWLLSAFLAMVPAFFMLFKARTENCKHYAGDMGQKSIEVCSYALAGLIIIIVGLYCRIYHEVLEYRHRTPQLNRRVGGNDTTPRSGETERNYKAFITTLLLSGTLVIFWLPYMVFHFISAHLDLENVPYIVFQIKLYVIDFLPMLNFLTDPIIYGIRMREIRDGYRRLFARLFPRCVKEPQVNRSSVRFTTLTSTDKYMTTIA